MAWAKIKREFLAVVMESPIYFSAPLLNRLRSRNFCSQRSVYYRICAFNLKTEGCYLKIDEFDNGTPKLRS